MAPSLTQYHDLRAELGLGPKPTDVYETIFPAPDLIERARAFEAAYRRLVAEHGMDIRRAGYGEELGVFEGDDLVLEGDPDADAFTVYRWRRLVRAVGDE